MFLKRTTTFFYYWLLYTYLATVFCTLLGQLWFCTLSSFAPSPHLTVTHLLVVTATSICLKAQHIDYICLVPKHSLDRFRNVYGMVLMQRQWRHAVWIQPHYQQAAVAEARDEYHGSAKTLSDTILLYKFC